MNPSKPRGSSRQGSGCLNDTLLGSSDLPQRSKNQMTCCLRDVSSSLPASANANAKSKHLACLSCALLKIPWCTVGTCVCSGSMANISLRPRYLYARGPDHIRWHLHYKSTPSFSVAPGLEAAHPGSELRNTERRRPCLKAGHSPPPSLPHPRVDHGRSSSRGDSRCG